MSKINTLVMIVGHERADFMSDSGEAFMLHHAKSLHSYQVVYAVDFDCPTADQLAEKYDWHCVFRTLEVNGWGRGTLRTIIHALTYFQERFEFDNLITMDSDSLVIGPILDEMVSKITDGEIFFVGTIWQTPGFDHNHHFALYFRHGFLDSRPFAFRTELVAGPFVLWTRSCLRTLQNVGLFPATEFEKWYPKITFAHDQLSTYLRSVGLGEFADIGYRMDIRWRAPLPTIHVSGFGFVPNIHPEVSVIHPTRSNAYSEEDCRNYFKKMRIMQGLAMV